MSKSVSRRLRKLGREIEVRDKANWGGLMPIDEEFTPVLTRERWRWIWRVWAEHENGDVTLVHSGWHLRRQNAMLVATLEVDFLERQRRVSVDFD